MGSGSYARNKLSKTPTEPSSLIPRRTTQLPETRIEEQESEPAPLTSLTEITKVLARPALTKLLPPEESEPEPYRPRTRNVVIDAVPPHPLERHKPWLTLWTWVFIGIIASAGILVMVGVMQRPGDPQLVPFIGGQVYSIQVGGNDLVKSWPKSKPLPQKTPLPVKTGPYSVLGKPTISADFINRVLTSYNSPAAGKGRAMYDLGVKYGIDPVYALAFFQHESTFGTRGEARTTLSLGNLRCIPDRPCIDQDRGGYAKMYSWEDGFEKWYELIRNLYVAQWGRSTVDQIIPKYAPNADNNNEQAYIRSVKHAVDTWRAGLLRP
jgi:hypothetical protein